MRKFVISALASAYVPIVSANSQQRSPYESVYLVALLVSLVALAYCANRWRLWWLGVQIGEASGREFMLALKWSVISPGVAIFAFWVAEYFK